MQALSAAAETAALLRRLQGVPVAAIADALDGRGIVMGTITAQTTIASTIAGPAYTVKLSAGDNLGLHHAVAEAPRGSVLVAAVGDAPEFGIWGEILAAAAFKAGIAAFVTDGFVRDQLDLERIGLPIFARGVCIRRAAKNDPGARQVPVRLAELQVCPGDIVCADTDGVVVVEVAEAAAVATQAEAIVAKERRVLDAVESGKTTLAALGLEQLEPNTEA